MRELAVVIPDYVWLTNLTGTVTPGVQVTNGAGLRPARLDPRSRARDDRLRPQPAHRR